MLEQKPLAIVAARARSQEQRAEISDNTFVGGLNAMQPGSAYVAQAGSEIAHNTVEARSPRTEQMVELTRGELGAQSGAWIIEVVDEILGILTDTHA